MSTTDSATPPATSPAEPSSSGRLVRFALVGGALLVMALGALPLIASLGYRSAVGDLHEELAAVAVDSARVVDERVDRCWNGVAPASVRVLEPVGGATVNQVVDDYVDALRPLGFAPGQVGAEQVTSRERGDDLDGDIIRTVIDEDAGTVTVVADAYDTDMVTCLPL